jgi:antitoxin HigA-1
MNTRRPELEPMHPGKLLAEIVLPALGDNEETLAAHLGIPQETLQAILRREEGITPALALRLGKLFGNGPEFWFNLQRDFDLWRLERELGEELAAIRPLALDEHVRVLDGLAGEGGDSVVVDRVLPRVATVLAQPPTSVLVTWSEGERKGVTETIDLAPMLFRFALYWPLRNDPELFRSVRVAAEGTALVWSEEIDLSATTLLDLASG